MADCKECGQPMLPKGKKKRPNEYDHAQGCPLSPNGKKYGTRSHPREMLTAEAAVNLCKESGRSMWVRLPMYKGKFHIWPGGRKEFWPDRERGGHNG